MDHGAAHLLQILKLHIGLHTFRNNGYFEILCDIQNENDQLAVLLFIFYVPDLPGKLCEVVTVGYGSSRKNRLTRAFGSKAAKSVQDDLDFEFYTAEDEEVMACVAMPMQASADDAPSPDDFGDIDLRTEQTHVAVWLPTLTADEDGNFQIDFDMPSDNTTWCLQALAYTQTLATDIFRAEVLAQRPVMVQPSLPRFLRSGDKTALFANVQNASDTVQQVSILIELFDPRTDKVIESRTCRLTLAAHGTEAVSIDCQAPTTKPYIGLEMNVKI